jgi:hypothetical protein
LLKNILKQKQQRELRLLSFGNQISESWKEIIKNRKKSGHFFLFLFASFPIIAFKKDPLQKIKHPIRINDHKKFKPQIIQSLKKPKNQTKKLNIGPTGYSSRNNRKFNEFNILKYKSRFQRFISNPLN